MVLFVVKLTVIVPIEEDKGLSSSPPTTSRASSMVPVEPPISNT